MFDHFNESYVKEAAWRGHPEIAHVIVHFSSSQTPAPVWLFPRPTLGISFCRALGRGPGRRLEASADRDVYTHAYIYIYIYICTALSDLLT